MRRSGEVSKSEERHLAVASATLGPWSAAAAVGGLGTAVALATDAIAGHFGLGLLGSSLSFGLLLFFAIGGTGAVLGRGGRSPGGPDRRIREWAREHPWPVAAVPAGGMLVTDFVVREILTSNGFLANVWDGLWRGVLVGAVVGVVGSVAASRRA